MPFIGEVLGVRGLPIEYEARGNRHALSISKVAEMEVEDVVKLDGKKSAIHNAPFEPLVYVAKSKKFKYSEHGMNWNISEKNSFHSPFSWRGP